MAFKREYNTSYLYVTYARESQKDFDLFRNTLADAADAKSVPGDVVIDMTEAGAIYSSELGLIAGLVEKLRGTSRYVHLIASPVIRDTVDSTGIDKLSHLSLHRDKASFLDTLDDVPES